MFKFGENWASFSRQLDEARIEEAMNSLVSLFGEGTLKGKSFLDIGCGSGLFSIAAARLGASRVVGLDIDPVSVSTSERNAEKWLGDRSTRVSIQQASALDTDRMKLLGRFDLVYSWGVLHHTGNMALALENAAMRVKKNGLFMIAIYNKHWSSPLWRLVKWLYNKVGEFWRKVLIVVFTPIIFAAKFLVTFKNPLKMKRGMDFMHNITDWVGGYPYEYADVSDMEARLGKYGFSVLFIRTTSVPTGCNEYVARLDHDESARGEDG
jgi:2-polyprenyl-6-hydroxyphenyl methylase/3-demethylubiquinone-9 3-methyltransferase